MAAQGGAEWPLVQITSDPATGLARSIQIAGVETKFAFAQATTDSPWRLASWSRGSLSAVPASQAGVPAETFTYGSVGELRSVTSPSGRKEVFTVDFEEEKPSGVVQVAQKNAKSASTTEAEPPKIRDSVLLSDSTFKYVYSAKNAANGSGVAVKDKLGHVQRVNFGRQRGVLTLTDAAGNATLVKYYRQLGLAYDYKVRQIKDAQGRVLVENKYDKEGNLIWSRDRLGNVAQYEVDSRGKITRVTRTVGKNGPSETVGAFVYDKDGRLVKAINALNHAVEMRYNSAGDLTGLTDAEGRKHERTYSSDGRLLSVTDALGRTTRNEFDAEGNLAATINPDSVATRYQRDPVGRLASFWMERSGSTRGSRVASDGSSDAAVTRMGKVDFVLDPLDHIIKQTNAIGHETAWNYDKQGRLIARTVSDGTEDAGTQPVRYTYNKHGRTTSVDYGNNNILKYEYNAEGRVAAVSTPTSSARYAFDKLGRLIELNLARGKETATLQYGYTPAGKKVSVAWISSDGNGKKMGRTDYRYNSLGQLAEIASDNKPVVKYAYDPSTAGLKEKQMVDGTRIQYAHDPLGRIAAMQVVSAKGKTLTEVRYAWDAANQLTSRTWNVPAAAGKVEQRYEYDSAGQLVGVRSSDPKRLPSETYVYDVAGNMIEKIIGDKGTLRTYDAANCLLNAAESGAATTAYEYDPAGRLLAQITGKDATRYQYGLLEKVSAVVKPDGARIGFDYWPTGQMAAKGTLPPLASDTRHSALDTPHSDDDPFGIKAARSAKNTAENNALTVSTAGEAFKETETFLWDGLALLQRGEETFTVEPHLSGGVPLVAEQHVAQSPPAVNVSVRPTLLISDFMGTTLGHVQGETFTPAPLTAFGESLAVSSPSAWQRDAAAAPCATIPRSPSTPQFFTGKPWDPDLQAYNFLFRNYQPQMARWPSRDPIGEEGGLNLYAFVSGDPISFIDALGMNKCCRVTGIHIENIWPYTGLSPLWGHRFDVYEN
ncbi:MAG: RHS repeat-associated core domain-containing protein [Verrucomicrobia bacterium]|nr:RHS repeat-associated core domain-containing protein [Verrucomicrobiota bacterium]